MATVEDVAAAVGVSAAEGGPLDQRVTDRHILDISRFMTQWETVAAYLEVSEADVEVIKEEHSNALRRREVMLKRWRSGRLKTATYRKLGEVFIDMGKVDDWATKVFEMAKSVAPPAKAPNPSVPQSEPHKPSVVTPYVGDGFFTDWEEKVLDDNAKRVLKKYPNISIDPLDRKSHFSDVRSALVNVCGRWKEIGIFLGIPKAELDAIEQQNRRKVNACLIEMVAKWFQMSTSQNPVTLRKLVGAIATSVGGKDPAHAEDVAKKYKVNPSSKIKSAATTSAAVVGYPSEATAKQTQQSGPEIIGKEEDYYVVRLASGGSEKQVYKMNCSGCHGKALIISNTEFDGNYSREYGEVDEGRMVDVFGDNCLNYKPILLRNLTADQIRFAIKLMVRAIPFSELPQDDSIRRKLSDFEDCSNVISCKDDSFFLIIMTHGRNGAIEGTDSKEVSEYEIQKMVNCQELKGKPKIVVIQACRTGSAETRDGSESAEELDLSDFVLQFSAYEGKTSNALHYSDSPAKQQSDGGGWFVNTLYETFRKMHGDSDLLEMLQEVGARVQKMKIQGFTQCPPANGNLRYKLYFHLH